MTHTAPHSGVIIASPFHLSASVRVQPISRRSFRSCRLQLLSVLPPLSGGVRWGIDRCNPLYGGASKYKFPGLVGYDMKLRVVLEPSEEGGYTVYVPSLPGCISEGDTKEEALENIREAIDLYLEVVDDDLVFNEKAEQIEIAV